jgi:hypothetical protein
MNLDNLKELLYVYFLKRLLYGIVHRNDSRIK